MGQNFQDAIYYPDLATYQAKVADGSHEAQKAKRLASYENAVKNPPASIEVTKAQLQAEKAALMEQVALLDTQIAAKGK